MRRKIIFVVLGCILIAAASLYTNKYPQKNEGVIDKEVLTSGSNLICKYYDEKAFMASVKQAENTETGKLKIAGGIAPHHLLANNLIAKFFKSISTSSQKVVILLGPNHNRFGREKIHTGDWNWQTPFGILETEKDIVSRIVQKTGSGKDMKLLEDEHSMAALMPYIKYYLPEARVVPLVLHGNLGLEESKALADTILECIGDKDYIIIGSVDFSHYLPPDETEAMDLVTIKAIEKRDLLAISHMGNDNLDSPPTIITVLEMMNKVNANGFKVLDHSNSSKMSGTYSRSNTSYYTLLFYEE
ncbi:MAG: AmmeMemoRadiSam system protein B [Clostridiales bacterium]|nr:AmmeMemoRadiSam system protein B [Clostridiales bacterium]